MVKDAAIEWARETFPKELRYMKRLWIASWRISKTISVLTLVALSIPAGVGGFVIGRFAGTTVNNNSIANPPPIININSPPAVPQPRGTTDTISDLSDRDILDYTIKFAAGLRTFESNAMIELHNATDFRLSHDEIGKRTMEIYEREGTEFRNTYLHPALALKADLLRRLQQRGIFIPVEREISPPVGGKRFTRPLNAFDGDLSGSHPIAAVADFLESAARRLQ
jgi:hypothetical protein